MTSSTQKVWRNSVILRNSSGRFLHGLPLKHPTQKDRPPWFTKFEFEKFFLLFYIISTQRNYILNYIKIGTHCVHVASLSFGRENWNSYHNTAAQCLYCVEFKNIMAVLWIFKNYKTSFSFCVDIELYIKDYNEFCGNTMPDGRVFSHNFTSVYITQYQRGKKFYIFEERRK
jgi:hypothetical protein